MLFKLASLYFLIGIWTILKYPKALCPPSLVGAAQKCARCKAGAGLLLAIEIAIAIAAGALGYQFGVEARNADPVEVARALGLEVVEVTTEAAKDMTINNSAFKALTE